MLHACPVRFDVTENLEKFLLFGLVPKILQNFLDFPSHRIFRRMHGILNIDENKN